MTGSLRRSGTRADSAYKYTGTLSSSAMRWPTCSASAVHSAMVTPATGTEGYDVDGAHARMLARVMVEVDARDRRSRKVHHGVPERLGFARARDDGPVVVGVGRQDQQLDPGRSMTPAISLTLSASRPSLIFGTHSMTFFTPHLPVCKESADGSVSVYRHARPPQASGAGRKHGYRQAAAPTKNAALTGGAQAMQMMRPTASR